MSTEIIETVAEVLEPTIVPVTLGNLGLRSFTGGEGTWQNSKAKCPPAARISMQDYLRSKTPMDTSQSRLVPLSPFQVIEEVANIFKTPEEAWSDVYVYRDHIRLDGYVDKHTQYTKQYPLVNPNIPISDMVFERVIAVMNLIPGDGELSYKMAIKYEPRLLEVAIGVNVRICNNWNIFNGNHFGVSSQLNFDAMMIKLIDIRGKIEELFHHDIGVINRLQNTPLLPNDTNELVGDLVMRYHHGAPVLALTDISDLGRELVKREIDGSLNNLWDFTNAGTQHLKFDNNSGDAALDAIAGFTQYMAEKAIQN